MLNITCSYLCWKIHLVNLQKILCFTASFCDWTLDSLVRLWSLSTWIYFVKFGALYSKSPSNRKASKSTTNHPIRSLHISFSFLGHYNRNQLLVQEIKISFSSQHKGFMFKSLNLPTLSSLRFSISFLALSGVHLLQFSLFEFINVSSTYPLEVRAQFNDFFGWLFRFIFDLNYLSYHFF